MLERRIAIVLALACPVASGQPPESAVRFFDTRVEPILRSRCLSCHNNELKAGGVSFLDRDTLLRQGRRGATLVPGRPNDSLLIQSVRQDGELKMPPGAKLSPEEITILTDWVERGAAWGTKLNPAGDSKTAQPLPFEIWLFDRTNLIGDHPATIAGRPRIVETPAGKALEFDGKGDTLFVDIHPLAGAHAFTWEVVFRPDPGGASEQRLFHMQEHGGNKGLLLDLAVVDGRWRLGSVGLPADAARALSAGHRPHSPGAWYHAAIVYDGREFRSYVDGALEGSALLQWAPAGEGRCSVGAGLNRRAYFKGAIRMTRITRGVLAPAEFLRLPAR